LTSLQLFRTGNGSQVVEKPVTWGKGKGWPAFSDWIERWESLTVEYARGDRKCVDASSVSSGLESR